jgi:excinuclease ABC subunit C
MTMDELRDKAHSLPLLPGVYIMMDKTGKVIYVGKAKKLKNRVSQYFQDSASHTLKTRMMVSQVDRFDVIMAATEFEALVLECSLIKRHMPKYNILLKDDKGYPYIRVDLREEYPRFSLVGKLQNDGASYFGPYGGRYVTQQALDTLRLTLKLPGCTLKFPRDIGKNRPCLNFQMGNCDGWCRYAMSPAAYRQRIDQAVLVLEGKQDQVADQLLHEMEEAAESLQFERAAELRDRYKALDALRHKQLVVAGAMADTDVVGFYQSEAKACFTVLHYIKGNLLDKDFEIVEPGESLEDSVSSLVKQYYLARGTAPRNILLPCFMEDGELFAQMLREQLGKAVRIHTPQRGDQVQLVALANRNAREEAERVTTREERTNGTLQLLGQMLGLDAIPRRMEAYDISNTGSSDIVASMTVFVDGKPLKKDYKRFKIEGLQGPDDYTSMRQVLRRRFTHFQAGDSGFDQRPDVLLIDGGDRHAAAVRDELGEMGISIPIFGMVKDNRHRTRALVTPDGQEIGIAATPVVFALIGRIQEETHRFAITYHRQLRSGHLKTSALDQIPGVGEKRRAALLKQFRSVAAIKRATPEQLAQVLPKPTAQAVYDYFHNTKDRSDGPEEESSCE